MKIYQLRIYYPYKPTEIQKYFFIDKDEMYFSLNLWSLEPEITVNGYTDLPDIVSKCPRTLSKFKTFQMRKGVDFVV